VQRPPVASRTPLVRDATMLDDGRELFREPHQRRFVALIVDPIAPNFAALRRVSSNADRA
jgi:hypothetical protein